MLTPVIVVISVLWLLHRVRRLLKVPPSTLVHILGIEIPDAPSVSIDAVTSSSVSLHWTPPEKASSVSKYVLEVDGKKAGETDRSDSSLTLKDLEPDKSYTLQVLAVNPSNYRSNASILRVHTRRNSEDVMPFDVTTSLRSRANTRSRATSSAALSSTFGSAARGSSLTRSGTNGSSGTGNNHNCPNSSHGSGHSHDRNKADKSAYTVESLTTEVEYVQDEINDILRQASEAEKEFQESETALIEQLKELREKKRAEDAHRSQIRSETKSLEDQKRSLEIQKSKIEKTLRDLEDTYQKQMDRINQWQQAQVDASNTIETVERHAKNIQKEAKIKIEERSRVLSALAAEVSTLEDATKQLSTKLYRLERTREDTKVKITKLTELAASLPGLLKKDAAVKILHEENSLDVEPSTDLIESVTNETETNAVLEDEWVRIQDDLGNRYVKVFKKFEEAKADHDKMLEKRKNIIASAPQHAVLNSVNAAVAAKKNNLPKLARLDTEGNNVASMSTNQTDEEPLSPTINVFLPKNLFGGADDLTESFASLLDSRLDNFSSTTNNNSLFSHQARQSSPPDLSPHQSELSLHHLNNSSAASTRSLFESAASGGLHHSPSGSSTSVPSNNQLHSSFIQPSNSMVHPAHKAPFSPTVLGSEFGRSSRKIASMFSFGKKESGIASDELHPGSLLENPKANGSSSSIFFSRDAEAANNANPVTDHSSLLTVETFSSDILPIGSQRRGSMASNNSSSVLNPWNSPASGVNIRPPQNLSSGIGSSNLAITSNPDDAIWDDSSSNSYFDENTHGANWVLNTPSISIIDSADSGAITTGSDQAMSAHSGASSSGNQSRFQKGLSGLFGDSKKPASATLSPEKKTEGKGSPPFQAVQAGGGKSIPMLFGKSDADTANMDPLRKRNSFVRRSTSSKFVRNLFGNKKDGKTDGFDDNEEMEEEDLLMESAIQMDGH